MGREGFGGDLISVWQSYKEVTEQMVKGVQQEDKKIDINRNDFSLDM